MSKQEPKCVNCKHFEQRKYGCHCALTGTFAHWGGWCEHHEYGTHESMIKKTEAKRDKA